MPGAVTPVGPSSHLGARLCTLYATLPQLGSEHTFTSACSRLGWNQVLANENTLSIPYFKKSFLKLIFIFAPEPFKNHCSLIIALYYLVPPPTIHPPRPYAGKNCKGGTARHQVPCDAYRVVSRHAYSLGRGPQLGTQIYCRKLDPGSQCFWSDRAWTRG